MDVTPFDLVILKTLAALDMRKIAQTDLADIANVSKSTIYRALNRLERASLIERRNRKRGRTPLFVIKRVS